MKLKLTNGEIFNSRESLQALIKNKFPVKTSFKLATLARTLSGPLKDIETVRMGLIKTYGEPKKDQPQTLWVDPSGEDFKKFNEELEELFKVEVALEIFKVKLPEKVAATCDKCHHNMDKEFEIEAAVLVALDKFVEV